MHNIIASDLALGLIFYQFPLLVTNVFTQQCVHLLSRHLNNSVFSIIKVPSEYSP
jgi:hypothetical protein